MNEKEKKKVIAQRKANTEKAEKRLEKEAKRVVEKSKKDAANLRRKGRDVRANPWQKEQHLATKTLSPVPRVPKSGTQPFAGLSTSNLQQCTVSSLLYVGTANMSMDELILNCSLLSIDQYSTKYNAYPKCWDDLTTFLEKVSNVFTQ
jgi:hypothetical protein